MRYDDKYPDAPKPDKSYTPIGWHWVTDTLARTTVPHPCKCGKWTPWFQCIDGHGQYACSEEHGFQPEVQKPANRMELVLDVLKDSVL